MSLREQYLAAQFPDIYYVLEWRLHPFSLGHALLLERLRSPFMVGGIPALGDLKLGVLVCRLPWSRSVRAVESRLLPWRLRCMPILTARRLMLGMGQFAGYIHAAHVGPQVWSRGDGESLAMPFLQAIKITMMMRLHKSEAEAMSTPLSLAWHDYAACWEMLGRLRIVGDADQEAIEAARKLYEEQHHGK